MSDQESKTTDNETTEPGARVLPIARAAPALYPPASVQAGPCPRCGALTTDGTCQACAAPAAPAAPVLPPLALAKLAIANARLAVQQLPAGRETSLVATNLQQAALWLTEVRG